MKRKSYTAGFKLEVVKVAKESNNAQAARKYGVTRKMVIDWRKQEEALKKMPKKQRARRSGIASWPELENGLAEWDREQRQSGRIVTRKDMRDQAMNRANSNPYLAYGFTATQAWCSRFMKRKKLVLRQKTKVAQKKPVDLEDKLRDFRWHVKGLTNGNEFPLGNIGNMDETPIFFDMIGFRTVDSKGAKSIIAKSTGHERTHFTRKRMPKENFPSGAFVHFHEKGWMDEQGARLWIDNIWRKRPGHSNSRSLLVWDSFRSHVAEAIKSHLNKCKMKTAVFPGGLRSVLQPLDVCINKLFKGYMREEWKEWMANGQKTYTASGRM
ncbi:BrkDBD and DDE 1 and HTH Tnp Tc5 domain containin g protein [Trichuris trichiura]|uniref:BrkDBD and DDE 1 and HTH Tnp Tc5 domain containin g protein n=1 Tax=Trichuris trichiura TaxID=36087 RepID=A0A077ZMW2_TRITR|nr:BrkDBD and DDE 1 and HTH Tnp Tc5 domain containin g protein [Trichuris trichiura]